MHGTPPRMQPGYLFFEMNASIAGASISISSENVTAF